MDPLAPLCFNYSKESGGFKEYIQEKGDDLTFSNFNDVTEPPLVKTKAA